MDTMIETYERDGAECRFFTEALEHFRAGDVVAFPTETVYGLGAIASNEEAVQKIFQAKGRPSDNPLIVHIYDQQQVEELAVNVPEEAYQLMDAFWPGPLTLILFKKEGAVAPSVTPGMETIGIRMPDHPVALAMLRQLQEPVAAPSANRSGKPSPTTAEHVYHDLEGRIPFIIDGGPTNVGVESTVIDMTTTPATILRPGTVTKEQIEGVIGPVRDDILVKKDQAPRAPGMKYMHYAPEAPLFVIEPDEEKIAEAIASIHEKGQEVAVIGPEELFTFDADWYFSVGAIDDKEQIAANLYRALRQCDLTDADLILSVETDLEGIGTAVMNRMMKASGGQRYE